MTLILDCDPGNGVRYANVDDSLTITILVSLIEDLSEDIQISTVFGNTPAEVGYDCTEELLKDLTCTDIAISCGARTPLSGNQRYWSQKLHHPVVSDTIRPKTDYAIYRDSTVIAIGPLTNVALAIRNGYLPREVYVMGGAIGFGSLVDTNFAIDPRSAAAVLSSNIKKTLIPLDVTRKTCLSLADWESIESHLRTLSPHHATSIASWLTPWIEHSMRTRPVDGMWIHDLVALAAYLKDIDFLAPDLLSGSTRNVSICSDTGKLKFSSDGVEVYMIDRIYNQGLIEFIRSSLLRLPKAVESSNHPAD